MVLLVPKQSKNEIVRKSNELIEARYRLSVEEQRLILLLASVIKPEDEDFKSYEIRVQDFARMFGLEKRKGIYTEVEEASKRLTGRSIELSSDGVKKYASWLSYVEYVEGSGVIKVEFHKSLKPYLLQLNKSFTQYQLNHVINFKSSYTIRLYELLKMEAFKAKNNQFERCFTIEEYRDYLGIEKKSYAIFSDLRKWIIEPTVREVSDYTDLNIFETRYTKTGRKITGLCFVVIIRGHEETRARQENLRLEETPTEEQGTHPVIEALMNYGFTFENAQSFKNKYGIKQIERNLAYMIAEDKNKPIKNKAGYLAKAILEDWGKGWETKHQEQQETKKQQAKKELTEAQREALELKKSRERHKQAFAEFEALEATEKEKILTQFKTQEVDKNPFLLSEYKKAIQAGKSPFDVTLLRATFTTFYLKNQENQPKV
jgi:plasmid replication initiation protein